MARTLQIVGLLLVVAAGGICDQNKGAKSPSPPPQKQGGAWARPNGGGAPRLGPPIHNPASPAARLYKATPEERDRVIEKLPPAQQERVRNQLRYFDSRSKEEQELMIRRMERFNAFTPEQRRAFLTQLRNLGQLPVDRRQAIQRALRLLELKPEADRIMILNSDQFKNLFSPEEQKIIADLSEVMLPPI